MTTFITFGSDHADLYPSLGSRLSEGYVAIDLPGVRHSERDLFVTLFGTRFEFDYPDRPSYAYRKGEIARITLINEGQRERIVDAIRTIQESRGADSMDAVFIARDYAEELLIELIGGTR